MAILFVLAGMCAFWGSDWDLGDNDGNDGNDGNLIYFYFEEIG